MQSGVGGVVYINSGTVQLRIEMLGGFAIIHERARITEQAKKSSKVWRLLQYLVTNRHKSVSQEELMEAFCDDELLGNPGSALRTMVYRARSALAKAGLECADDLIIAKSGGYSWSSNITTIVDIEEFEDLCKRAGSENDRDEKLELLLAAAELYKGDFLPNSSGDMWVIPLVRYYRSMYLACIHDALELLMERERSSEAEALCAKALCIDPFDEIMIGYRLRSLISQGKHAEALEEYKRMETMFFDVLGVNFSDNLRALHSQIQKPDTMRGLTLEAMLHEWLEDADHPGAYYCDVSVFKILFQIESRSVPRSGRTAFIVRFDTKHEPNAKDGGVMKQLGMAIPGCLRMGDLFTRASPSQYMLMLYSLTYEDCKMLVSRVLRSLDARYLPRIISTTVKPVRAIEG